MKTTIITAAILSTLIATAADSGDYALLISKNDSNFEIIKGWDSEGNIIGKEEDTPTTPPDTTVYTGCALPENNASSYNWFKAVQRGDLTVTGLGYDTTNCFFYDNIEVSISKAITLDDQVFPIDPNGDKRISKFVINALQTDEVKLGTLRITDELNFTGYQNNTLDLTNIIYGGDSQQDMANFIIQNTNLINLNIETSGGLGFFNTLMIHNNTSLKNVTFSGHAAQSLTVTDNTALESFPTGKICFDGGTINNNGISVSCMPPPPM